MDSRFRGNDGYAWSKGVGVALAQIVQSTEVFMQIPYHT